MNLVKRRKIILAVVGLALVVVVAVGATVYAAAAASRITGQQTVVLTPEQFSPGEQATLRAVVQDFNSGAPLPGAAVTVSLVPRKGGKGLTVFQGQTDQRGAAEIRFDVPENLDEEQTLVVETTSPQGADRLERPVNVRRDYKLLLTTDKPLYQPGQTIHIRSLALDSANLKAADGEEIEFIVEDPKGNKVLRQSVSASEWGIASLDFVLASEVNTGRYKIVAHLGETESERTVTVKPYVLPKFRISVETDKTFYLPGQTVEGHLQADYFFGKPVAEGEVEISGYVYEVERRQVMTLKGTTDEKGRFDFKFELPAYFVSGAPEVGQATFGLEVTVIDQAEHAEQTAHTLPVAEEPIIIDAVPESGTLKPGVENVVYIITSYPDGAPAETDLTVEVAGEKASLTTGRYGLAEFTFVPEGWAITISARDKEGQRVTRTVELSMDSAPEYVLLRPERAAYRVGETMHLEALTTAQRGTIYLDIVREGQTLSTRALEIKDGRAVADVDLDEALFGTLQLHAYKVLADASIVADTRLVVVDRAADIQTTITADKDTYKPGETATISFQTAKDGQPLPAALGISVVDESVFALQEQEAGFAKLYFLLQAELLEPKYQIKGFSPLGYIELPEEQAEVRAAQDRTARAALAYAPTAARQPLARPRYEKQNAIEAERQVIYARTANGVTWGLAALSLLGLILSVVVLWRGQILGKSLGYGVIGFFTLGGVVTCVVAPLIVSLYESELIEWVLLIFLAGLGLAALVSLVGLAVHAWRAKDGTLAIMLFLMVTCLLLLALLGYLSSRAEPYDWEARFALGVLVVGLLVLGFYLRGMGFAVKGQRWPAAAGIILGGILLLPTPLIVVGAAMTAVPASYLRGIGGIPVVPVPLEEAIDRRAAEPTPTPLSTPLPTEKRDRAAGEAQEPPRLRQYFPETLYWNPQVLTDDEGQAELEIPMADSITTWRMSVLASSQRGELGNAVAGLRVFQDFFIDLDLPLYLTQNDQVSLPVAVFNYLPQAQEVRLEVEEEDWFELLDEEDREKKLTIEANDVEVVYFPIRALKFGRNRFQVTAWGERMSDAIAKEIQVVPDGKEFRLTKSDNLRGSVKEVMAIPEEAIPGTARIYVKVYPGIVSQIVEGLQGMLRMPFG